MKTLINKQSAMSLSDQEIITNHSKAFESIINERRSIRKYDPTAYFDEEIVKKCIQKATLAPNSSNMQLWEFYRVKSIDKKEALAKLCLKQSAATTANELIVIVVRPDLWKERKDSNQKIIEKAYEGRDDKQATRALKYYSKLIPLLYRNDVLGITTLGKKIVSWFVGLKKPMVREVGKNDIRVVVHKSAALAAMTFMYAMKAEGYDTCPMEGMDSKRIKKLLKLPNAAQINMVISCGKGLPEGIYGERTRVPFEEVYFEV